MLIALSGKLTGYNGTFPFEKPGDKFDGAKYEGMRIVSFHTNSNIRLIIDFTLFLFSFVRRWELWLCRSYFWLLGKWPGLWWLRLWELYLFYAVSFMRYFIVNQLLTQYTFSDIGFLTLNRYILLDPILLFFMSGSMLGMVKVRRVYIWLWNKSLLVTQIYLNFQVTSCTERRLDPLSVKFLFWQIFLGTMLVCTISVKFVGLFMVLLAGLRTIADLWDILGDLAKPVVSTNYPLLSNNIFNIITFLLFIRPKPWSI